MKKSTSPSLALRRQWNAPQSFIMGRIRSLVSNTDGSKHAAVQEKTNQKFQTYWLLTERAEQLEAPRLFYIMVNLTNPMGHPECHVVPSDVVAKAVKENHKEWLKIPG